MVSMREALAPIAYAPPPLVAVPNAPPECILPRDGKAVRALMVGGHEHTARELKSGLLAFGIALLSTHWHMGRARLSYDLPVGTELVLLVTTVISHELSDHARSLAAKANVPYVGISTKASTWVRSLRSVGLTSPPPWRVPEVVSVAIHDEPPEAAAPVDRDPFGEVLLRVRKEALLSQRDLGLRIAVQPSSVSAWEAGRQTPRFAYYRALLEALPKLRDFAPPRALEGRVMESLAPSPAAIAQAAPPAPVMPVLSPIADVSVRYSTALLEAESHKRTADNLMRAAEDSLEQHKAASERASALHSELLSLIAKG